MLKEEGAGRERASWGVGSQALRGGTMLRHRPGVPEGLEREHTAGERPILGTFLGKDDSELFRF